MTVSAEPPGLRISRTVTLKRLRRSSWVVGSSNITSPGRITNWHTPGGPGVRIDSHAFNGYFVPPNYDSMIAKVITYGDTRDQALARMRTALSEMVVEGISTNIPLHRELLQDARFIEGGTSIHYLENKLAQRP